MTDDRIAYLLDDIEAALDDKEHLHEYTHIVTPEVFRKITPCIQKSGGCEIEYFCGIPVITLTEDYIKKYLPGNILCPNAFLVRNGQILTAADNIKFSSGTLYPRTNAETCNVLPEEHTNIALEDFLNSIPEKKEFGHASE